MRILKRILKGGQSQPENPPIRPTSLHTRQADHVSGGVYVPRPIPDTPINRDFHSFTLMPAHINMAAMIDRMKFSPERPSFYRLNVGETHYPYALPGEPENQWPKIH